MARRKTGFFQSFEKYFWELMGGIILLAVSTVFLITTLHYKNLFAETEGKIVSQQPIDSYSKYYSSGRYMAGKQYYIYEVIYQVNGKEFYSNQYTTSSDSLKSGDMVKIRYRKNNPGELIDYQKINSNSIMGIICGILLIIIGLADSKILTIR